MSTEDIIKEEKGMENEMDRLRNIEDQNGGVKKALEAQIAKNQNYEMILVRISAFLDEILKANHRSTYMITMAKDIIDNRNNMGQQQGQQQ